MFTFARNTLGLPGTFHENVLLPLGFPVTTPHERTQGLLGSFGFRDRPRRLHPSPYRFLSWAVQILRKALRLATHYLNCQRAAMLMQIVLQTSLHEKSIRIQNYSITEKKNRTCSTFTPMSEGRDPHAMLPVDYSGSLYRLSILLVERWKGSVSFSRVQFFWSRIELTILLCGINP
jgi:hypothetical protein